MSREECIRKRTRMRLKEWQINKRCRANTSDESSSDESCKNHEEDQNHENIKKLEAELNVLKENKIILRKQVDDLIAKEYKNEKNIKKLQEKLNKMNEKKSYASENSIESSSEESEESDSGVCEENIVRNNRNCQYAVKAKILFELISEMYNNIQEIKADIQQVKEYQLEIKAKLEAQLKDLQ